MQPGVGSAAGVPCRRRSAGVGLTAAGRALVGARRDQCCDAIGVKSFHLCMNFECQFDMFPNVKDIKLPAVGKASTALSKYRPVSCRHETSTSRPAYPGTLHHLQSTSQLHWTLATSRPAKSGQGRL